MTDLFTLAEKGRLEPGEHDLAMLCSARDEEGRSLLHVCDSPKVLTRLLAAGLDPNARDKSGLTPLMRSRYPESNRLLIQGGADVLALDPQGNSVLAHQAGVLVGCIGYCGPNLEALDVLKAAGAAPPSQEEAEVWIADAHAQVCSAGEHNEACSFEYWLRKFYA